MLIIFLMDLGAIITAIPSRIVLVPIPAILRATKDLAKLSRIIFIRYLSHREFVYSNLIFRI